MKYLGTALLFILLLTMSCDGKKKSRVNCSKWHNGQFEIVDDNRNILIERTGKIQTETDRNSSSYTKFTIVWTDNCTYQLTFLEGEEGVYQAWKNNFMEVTITGPTSNGYGYMARFSNSETTESGQVTQIK